MTKEAEIEAWIRGRKRIIHNQYLIQALTVLAMIVPLPLTSLLFWIVFGLGLPIVIQGIVSSWLAATIIYVVWSAYVRIKQRS
jgi:hypothetical protein